MPTCCTRMYTWSSICWHWQCAQSSHTQLLNYEENRLIDLLMMCFTVFIQRSINKSAKKKKKKMKDGWLHFFRSKISWGRTSTNLSDLKHTAASLLPAVPVPVPVHHRPDCVSPHSPALQIKLHTIFQHCHIAHLLSVWRRSLAFFDAAVCQNVHRPPANVLLLFPLSLCVEFNFESGLKVMCDVSV